MKTLDNLKASHPDKIRDWYKDSDGYWINLMPGWQFGEVMGVLTEVSGRQVFQAKAEIVEATPERLERLRGFREDLQNLIRTTK